MMQIDTIINEVIDRLEYLFHEKKCLVLSADGEMTEQIETCVNTIRADGYAVTICEISQLSENAKTIVHRFDSFIIADLSISQMVSLHSMAIHDDCLKIIYEIIRQGKEIRVFSEDLQLSTAGKAFRAEIVKRLLELANWGITFPQIEESMYRKVEKKTVTKQDLKGLETEVIAAGSDTVITTGAYDYMKSHGISFVRMMER